MRLAPVIDAMLDRVVSPTLRHDPDIYRQAKRVAAFDVSFVFWVVVFGSLYFALGSPWCGIVTLWAALPILGSLWTIERGWPPVVGGNLLCLAGFVPLTSLGLLTGGWMGNPPMLWYTLLPVIAVLTCGVFWGFVWTLISAAGIGGFALLQYYGVLLPQELRPEMVNGFGYAVVVGLLASQFILAAVRVGIEQRALAALAEAKRELARVRCTSEALKAGFGISLDDWARLQREKAALEYFVRRRFGTAETDDEEADLDDGDLDDSDLENSDLDDLCLDDSTAGDR